MKTRLLAARYPSAVDGWDKKRMTRKRWLRGSDGVVKGFMYPTDDEKNLDWNLEFCLSYQAQYRCVLLRDQGRRCGRRRRRRSLD